MTNEEALEEVIATIVELDWRDKRYVSEHLSSEALIACMNALGHQIQKKPLEDRKYYGVGKCPVCRAVFCRKDLITPFCGNCGQALDWSEE